MNHIHKADPIRISAQDANLILERFGAPNKVANRSLKAFLILLTLIAASIALFIGFLIFSVTSQYSLKPLPASVDYFRVSVVSVPTSRNSQSAQFSKLSTTQSESLSQLVSALLARKQWAVVIAGPPDCEIRISAIQNAKSIAAITFRGNEKNGSFYFGKNILQASQNDIKQLYDILTPGAINSLLAQTCRQ